MSPLRFGTGTASILATAGLLVTVACGESSPSDLNAPGSLAGTPSGGTTAGAAGSVNGGGATSAGAGGTTATSGASSTAGSTTGGSAAGGNAAAGSTSGGSTSTSGSTSGGSTSTGGSTSGGSSGAAGASGAGGSTGSLEPFSFFVTSLEAIRRESGNEDGYGGDLGGLTGADEICRKIAEKSMPGAGAKGWRAFLSTSTANAIDRIGSGPWYDRVGRVVAMNINGLLSTRPAGDSAIINDLPNESGVPNRAGTGSGTDDNHDVITGSNAMGKWDGGATCEDWTSAMGGDGPRVGHAWPAQSGMSWIQAHTAPGCEPSVSLTQTGAGSGNGIGNGGGYGGFYCFALQP